MQPRTVAIALLMLSLALLVPAVVVGETDTDENATLDRTEAWQAPASEAGFDDAADVRAAIDGGRLSRATEVNATHLLVVELGLRGFDEALGAADGSTTTGRFQAALREHGDLEIQQTNMGPNRAPLAVDALNGTGVTVYPDATNDTYYLVIDLANTTALRNDSPTELSERREYEFDVGATLAADSPLTAGEQRAMTAVAPREVSVDTAADGRVQLRPLPNQTVSGTTNLGTGSTVRVVLSGESNPQTDANESFRLARETTVDVVDDRYRYEGGFTATFDATDVSPRATNVTVDVRARNRSILDRSVSGRVNGDSASVAARDVVEDGGSAGVTVNGSLSAGGFFVLHAETADGPVVGHSPYAEPGEETATVYVNRPIDADELVVVAHRDANHNQWFDGPATDVPYSGPGTADAVQFDVELPGSNAPGGPDSTPTPTVTPTTTPAEPTPTPTATQPNGTSPDDATPGSGTTETDQPGSSSPGGTVLPALGVLSVVLLLVVLVRARS
jgi:hypothetical protein